MNHSASNVIPIHTDHQSDIITGTVIQAIPGAITINLAGDVKEAGRAFSCLVDPIPGDVVICAQKGDGTVYILGIIERSGRQETTITFPENASIQTHTGGLTIHSGNNVTIASKKLTSVSKQAVHKSDEAIISYDTVTATGNELQAGFKTIRVISNLINTMAKQVIDRFNGYIRKTETNDMVKSGQMTRQTDGLYAMDSKHTIMSSKESTKIDGKKILMG